MSWYNLLQTDSDCLAIVTVIALPCYYLLAIVTPESQCPAGIIMNTESQKDKSAVCGLVRSMCTGAST